MFGARAGALSISLILIGGLVMARPARGDDDPYRVQWGLTGGLRQNVGDVGDTYGAGWMLGVIAAYQPASLPVGVVWSWLFGLIDAKDPATVDQDLSVIEMNFGLRGRFVIPRTRQYALVTAGVGLLRSENTLPPDDERIFVGPFVAVGWERPLIKQLLIAVEVRYGLIAGGPASVDGLLSFKLGSR